VVRGAGDAGTPAAPFRPSRRSYAASSPTIGYKDEKSGDWKDGNSYDAHDLLALAEVAPEAAFQNPRPADIQGPTALNRAHNGDCGYAASRHICTAALQTVLNADLRGTTTAHLLTGRAVRR
jgi:hypothetical protein